MHFLVYVPPQGIQSALQGAKTRYQDFTCWVCGAREGPASMHFLMYVPPQGIQSALQGAHTRYHDFTCWVCGARNCVSATRLARCECCGRIDRANGNAISSPRGSAASASDTHPGCDAHRASGACSEAGGDSGIKLPQRKVAELWMDQERDAALGRRVEHAARVRALLLHVDAALHAPPEEAPPPRVRFLSASSSLEAPPAEELHVSEADLYFF